VTRLGLLALLCLTLLGPTAAPALAADKDPVTPEQHFANAQQAMSKQDYATARKELKRAIDAREDYPEAYLQLAILYRRDDELRQAMTQVRKALKFRPDYPAGHYLYGRLFLDQNNPDKAEAEARTALELMPTLAAAHVLMGDIAVARRDARKAVVSYKQALANLPADSSAAAGIRERYETLSSYAEYQSHEYNEDPEYVKAKIVPPYPRPQYTESARQNGVSGHMDVAAHLNVQGTVDKVIVFTGLPDGLTGSAIAAVKQIRAEPARFAGQPIAAWLTIRVTFTVR
jgi:TonB family protein